ncbi:MAG: NAD(P)H-dependent oxidoreductase [Actinomycetaceae bacterium]|nr:NAD(P)H-dependent oxidoreductase [Actinomycetaceae bacterium]
MAGKLIAYFSGTGRTARMANRLDEALGDADVFVIEAAQPYTEADLDYTDKHSRTTIECADPATRPELASLCTNLDDYDVIFLGMPIWWFKEAPIIRTFLEAHSWAGKTIIPFVTSGSSGYGETSARMKEFAPDATIVDGTRLRSSETVEDLRQWAHNAMTGTRDADGQTKHARAATTALQ